jgi:hypothetical protein
MRVHIHKHCPQKGKGNVPDMIATFTYMHRYLAHDYSASAVPSETSTV